LLNHAVSSRITEKRVSDVGEYVKIAETKDVSKKQMRVFKVKGREILLLHVEGEFYAFENRCPHMGYPLFFGSLEGDVLTCGFHSAKFHVRTGKSIGPATGKPLRVVPVKIQKSSILVKV
jgi:nitrite reductase/ring-hydroxylating ferredoxin subunit